MKHFLTIILICVCLSGFAQEKHFVFIQSDTNQPFYVSLNGKLYSSSASGYVIIPKLVDGDYTFSVGFAQNAFPEQSFQCTINRKDLGFNLKNFGEKGWGLFNLQSMDVTMATTGGGSVAKAVSETAAVKDTGEPVISFERKKEPEPVKAAPEKPADTTAPEVVTTKEEPARREDPPVAKADTNASPAATSPPDEPRKKEPAVTAVEEKKDTVRETKQEMPAGNDDVKKVSEVTSAEGVHLSYSEKNGKHTDTIQIIIPSSKASIPDTKSVTSADTVVPEKSVSEAPSKPSGTNATDKKDAPKFLDVDMSKVKKDPAAVTTPRQDLPVLPANSNCKNVADDEDYAKLRRRMSMETTDEKMISEARKVYREKCFTTSQIKRLSTLFLSDEGRFKFFDASYLSVSDAAQYPTLQSEFIDPVYLQRFKEMLQ